MFLPLSPEPKATEGRTRRSLNPRQWFNSKKVSQTPDVGNLPSSAFLQLPYTIRRRIYSYVFADRYIIYFRLKRHGRTGLRLGQSHAIYPPLEGSRVSFSYSWGRERHPIDIRHYLDWRDLPYHGCAQLVLPATVFEDNNFDGPLDLALLYTCRQLYLECTPLLYSTNTFNITRIEDLDYLAQTIPSHGLRIIRYLQIMSWTAVLSRTEDISEPNRGRAGQRILTTKMPSLRELWIELQLDRSSTEDKISNLAPLEKLRGLREFHLMFSHWLCPEPPGQLDRLKEYRDYLVPQVKSPREVEDVDMMKLDI